MAPLPSIPSGTAVVRDDSSGNGSEEKEQTSKTPSILISNNFKLTEVSLKAKDPGILPFFCLYPYNHLGGIRTLKEGSRFTSSGAREFFNYPGNFIESQKN